MSQVSATWEEMSTVQQTALTALNGAIGNLGSFYPALWTSNNPYTMPSSAELDSAVSAINASSPPTLGGTSVSLSGITPPSSSPNLGTVTPHTPQAPIPFGGGAPSVNVPASPTVTTPTWVGTPPALSPPTMPTAPMLQTVSVPNLTTITVPPAPVIDFPVFSGDIPEFVPALDYKAYLKTVDTASLVGERFTTDLTDAIMAELAKGGDGIMPQDYEEKIWQRHAARNDIALDEAIDTTMSTFARRGFPAPPTQAYSAIVDLTEKLTLEKNERSWDAAIKQLEVSQAHLHFILDKSLTLEQAQMRYAIEYAGLGVTVMKANLEGAIEIGKMAIAEYNAQVEMYKAQLTSFTEQIRAETAKVEVYRAQVEAEKARGEINQQLVDLYTAQLNANEAQVKMYATQAEAAKVIFEVERSKLEAFKLQVDIYVAQLQSQEYQIRVYEAQLQGNKTQLEVYRAQIDQNTAQNQATTEYNRTLIADADSKIKEFEANIALLQAQVASYRAQVDYAAIQRDFEFKRFEAESQSYDLRLKAQLAVADAHGRRFAALAETNKAHAASSIAASQITSGSITSSNQLSLQRFDAIVRAQAAIMTSLQNTAMTITTKKETAT